jgi:hypothetical protein
MRYRYESAWERPRPKWRREWRRTLLTFVGIVVLVGGLAFAALK